MSESELARDLHEVLLRVRQGLDVVVEQDHHAIAMIRPLQPMGRPLSECIALAEARGSTAVLDEGFMKDVEQGKRTGIPFPHEFLMNPQDPCLELP